MDYTEKSIENIKRIIDKKIALGGDFEFYEDCRKRWVEYAKEGVNFSVAQSFEELIQLEKNTCCTRLREDKGGISYLLAGRRYGIDE